MVSPPNWRGRVAGTKQETMSVPPEIEAMHIGLEAELEE
jgi:hypothetical protein